VGEAFRRPVSSRVELENLQRLLDQMKAVLEGS